MASEHERVNVRGLPQGRGCAFQVVGCGGDQQPAQVAAELPCHGGLAAEVDGCPPCRWNGQVGHGITLSVWIRCGVLLLALGALRQVVAYGLLVLMWGQKTPLGTCSTSVCMFASVNGGDGSGDARCSAPAGGQLGQP